jgi:hypothetical protein
VERKARKVLRVPKVLPVLREKLVSKVQREIKATPETRAPKVSRVYKGRQDSKAHKEFRGRQALKVLKGRRDLREIQEAVGVHWMPGRWVLCSCRL